MAVDEAQIEADEAFARQLQNSEAQGLLRPNFNHPLVLETGLRPEPHRRARDNVRVNALHDSLRDVGNVGSSRVAVLALLVVNLPQIVAAISVLSLHWDEDTVCDSEHRLKWKVWVLVATVRMSLHFIAICGIMLAARLGIAPSSQLVTRLYKARNALDVAGLIWFLVGNMWLFGGNSEEATCHKPTRSPVYNISLAMIILQYIQICLPCIIAVLMIPVLCFCLPCLVHVLRWFRDPVEGKGASSAAIDKLPVSKFRDLEASGDLSVESSCPICLADFSQDDEIRILPCKHYYHKECSDQWLAVNSTCPTCRSSILETPPTRTPQGESELVDLQPQSQAEAV